MIISKGNCSRCQVFIGIVKITHGQEIKYLKISSKYKNYPPKLNVECIKEQLNCLRNKERNTELY